MNIAFFGASSQIAKGLIKNFIRVETNKLYFFVRDKESFTDWLIDKKLNFDNSQIKSYDEFSKELYFDLLINCIGAGDPQKTEDLSSSIISITEKYDLQVLRYLESHSNTKYIFLSSGAAYGNIFSIPPETYDQQNLDINSNRSEDMYAISKMMAERRHRDNPQYSIIDIRIFSYFDSEVNINNRFFLTDALRSVYENKIFITNRKNIIRDYIGANDLYQLILQMTARSHLNTVVDTYSRAPIDKFSILEVLTKNFEFKYKFEDTDVGLNATGNKEKYYSRNFCARKYGYTPTLSSEGIIISVATSILGS